MGNLGNPNTRGPHGIQHCTKAKEALGQVMDAVGRGIWPRRGFWTRDFARAFSGNSAHKVSQEGQDPLNAKRAKKLAVFIVSRADSQETELRSPQLFFRKVDLVPDPRAAKAVRISAVS